MNIIPGVGPLGAKLMIIGEAPGKEEEEKGEPFVGDSGRILRFALKENGIHPDECYITNVINIRPPHNDLKMLALPISSFVPRCIDEIKKVNPNCILLVGGTALKYIGGLDKITRWRGSIISILGKWKGVPCIHPADFIRDGDWKKETIFRCFDVKRACEESKSPSIDLPSRLLWVCSNSMQLIRFLDKVNDKLSVDIETLLSLPLCIGLSANKNEAMSIRLLYPHEKPRRDLVEMWKILIEYFGDMHDKIKIIGQNFKFDQYICNTVGLRIPNPYSDTMFKAHTCYPELPKSLEFLTSVYTREPYYKDERIEYDPKKHGIERILLYNAKDAAVTLEVDEVLENELTELRLKDFYYNYVMKGHLLYYDIESVGMLIDKDKQIELKHKYFNMYQSLDIDNRMILGHSFNPNSVGPKGQCEAVVFGELKCPKRKNTKEDTILQMIGNKVIKDEKQIKVCMNMLNMRKVRKTLGTYILAKTDNDNRIRTAYNMVATETGRSGTQKLEPPLRVQTMGWPFQNITKHSDIGKDIREMIIADPGYVFLEMDKSQAEGRIVALLSKDYELLKAYDEIDVHSLTAAPIFGMTYDEIRKEYKAGNIEKRQLGKKTRHAGNYGMGKNRFMLVCAQDDIMISEKNAALYLFKFHQANPKIKSIYWTEVKECIERDRTLINPFGRIRQFFGRANEDLYKEAYANIPQSTVPDSLRMELYEFNRENKDCDFNIVQEGHDSILALVKNGEEKDVAKELKKYQEQPIDFSGCSLSRGKLVIPVEFKVGERWSEMEDLTIEG